MKWREPWRNTLRRQAPLNLLTRDSLRDALAWTGVLLVVGAIRAVGSDTQMSEVASRAWIAPLFGFGLSWTIRVINWLGPFEVTSGPRGIVRSKGDAMTLIPWGAIRSYRIYEQDNEHVLELQVDGMSDHARLYLPAKVRLREIEDELKERVSTAAGRSP